MSDANTSYDVDSLITMMGGVRLPLFCRYVPRNMPPSLFVFLIPGNSDHISYKARARCPNHARKFFDPSVIDKALGGRSYVDNNPYNVRSVVNLDEVLKEIGKFGHIIPGAAEDSPKNIGTYYTIGNTRTNGLASTTIASSMMLDMYYSFKIHNIRMLIPNMPVTLMREHVRQLFLIKTFIPFTRESLACAIDAFECSKCRFAGLCDMGQIPIGILSSSTIHLGNPLFVRKGDLSLVRYKKVSEITGTTVYGRRGPMSDQVSSFEDVSPSRFTDSSMVISPHESEFFQSKTEPYEDPEFVWAKFDEVQIDYRHYFRINVDTDRDVIDSSLEDMVVSENSFDARLVLASRGVFDELPALREVFGL